MATKKKVKVKPKPKDSIGREPLIKTSLISPPLFKPPIDRYEMTKLSWRAMDELSSARSVVESMRDSCDVKRVERHLQALEDTLEKIHRKIRP